MKGRAYRRFLCVALAFVMSMSDLPLLSLNGTTVSAETPGSTRTSAIAYGAPGPQASNILNAGSSWYSVGLEGNRTFTLSATGGTGVSFYNGAGTQLRSCPSATCSFTPDADATYYARVDGAAGTAISLSSKDGLSFGGAYEFAANPSDGAVSNSVPGNGVAFYRLNLSAGTTYTFTASGPSTPVGLVVYDGAGVQVAGSSADALAFSTPSSGTYYVQVNAGTNSGAYTFRSVVTLVPGTQSVVLSGSGWYAVQLAANRTATVTASGGTYTYRTISFYDSTGRTALKSCSFDSCSFTPTTSGVYRVYVNKGETVTSAMSLQDGASFTGANGLVLQLGATGVARTLPGGESALYKVELAADTPYVVTGSGAANTPAGLTVYDSAQAQVATSTNQTLSFRTGAAGAYYVELAAGAVADSYTLQVLQALPFGTQTSSINGAGWYGIQLAANRTVKVTAPGGNYTYRTVAFYDSTGGTALKSCAYDTCSYTPTTAGVYRIYVNKGAAVTSTITLQDGASFAGAYTIGLQYGAGNVSNSVPGNDAALFRVDLAAGGPYLITGSGLGESAGIEVYDSAQNSLTSTMTGTLNFQPSSAGSYYILLRNGATTGEFRLAVVQSLVSGSQTSTINSIGWYGVQLTAYRTVKVTATGGTSAYRAVRFYDSTGTTALQSCSLDTCSYSPTTTSVYRVNVTKDSIVTSTITVENGSDFAGAYSMTQVGSVAAQPVTLPPGQSGYLKVQLSGGTPYVVGATGSPVAATISMYDLSENQVAASSTLPYTFTPQTTGTYYIRVDAGETGGSYNVSVAPDTTIADLTTAANTVVSGVVNITGTAKSDNLMKWVLRYGAGTEPTSWTVIRTGYSNVTSGTLSDWDTYSLPAGTYTLQLDTYDKAVYRHTDLVTVQVANSRLALNPPTTFSDTFVDLSWQMEDTTGLSRFEVYRSSTSGAGFVLSGTNKLADLTDPAQRGYRATGLTASTTYFFKLRAVFQDGRTSDSNEVAATTRASAPGSAAAQVTTYAYDAGGNLVTVTDPNSNTTTYEYDLLNRVTAIQSADGSRSTNTYDPMGRLLSSTDPTGAVTQRQYNALGQPARETDPDGIVTVMEYDALGRLIRQTDGLGNSTAYTLDVWGQVAAVADALGNTVSFHYDANGNRTSVTDPNNSVTQYGYDTLDRLTSATDPLGNEMIIEYDAVGNRTRVSLPNTAVWAYAYNERNQLIRVTEPTGAITSLAYDPKGRLQSITNGNNQVTLYSYDSLSNLAAVTDPLGLTTRFTHDANGNRTSVADRKGSLTRYWYDALNRPTKIEAADVVPISFVYDAASRRTAMTDGQGVTRYDYTLGGRLKQKVTPDGKIVSYAYDARGLLSSVTDFSRATVQLAYDAAGKLVRVQDQDGSTVEYQYDAGGRRSKLVLPGGVEVSYQYDAANRLVSLVNGRNDGSVISQFSYAYDEVGNITGRTDAIGTTTYSYDLAGRLKSYVKPEGFSVTYTYDGAGNRATETTTDAGTLKTRQYSYDAANRLLKIAAAERTVSFTYDADGNMLTDGRNSYGYDGLNRLVSISGEVTAAYAYDGDGLRVRATVGAETTNFYWDGDQIGLETNGLGATIARNLYGLGRLARILGSAAPGYQATGNNRGYYLYDGHGDVKAITDPLGAVLAAYDYDPWGKVDGQSGSFDNPYRYAGEYQDTSTGLYYLRARFYDPSLARFLSEDAYAGDPGDPLSLNLYTYVQNNPLAYVDPSGHWPESAFWQGFGRGFVKTAAIAGAVIVGAALLPATVVIVGGVALIGYGLHTSFKHRKQEQMEACVDAGFLKTAGVAALDTLGLSGLIEGATRQRMLTGARMTPEQAGEAMGTGAASVVAWMAGPKLTRTVKSRMGPSPMNRLLSDEGGYVRIGGETASEGTGRSGPFDGIDREKPVIVVGESMEARVDVVAAQLREVGFVVRTWIPEKWRTNSPTPNPLDMEANRSWLRYWTLKRGATVVDIGIDVSRKHRSLFYAMERRSLYENWSYPNIVKHNPGF